MIREACKSNICRVDWQAGDTEKGQCCGSSPKVITLKTQERVNVAIQVQLPLAQGKSSFCSIQAFK